MIAYDDNYRDVLRESSPDEKKKTLQESGSPADESMCEEMSDDEHCVSMQSHAISCNRFAIGVR